MLDELSAINIRHQYWRHKRLIKLLHEIDGVFALRSDHDAIRAHQIGYCTTFPQKFRITDYVEVGAVAVISFD